jgi:hypothetical protein
VFSFCVPQSRFFFVVANFNRAQQLLRLEDVAGTPFDVFTAGGDTVYAAGFADDRFLQVRDDMSESQVIALLGERYCPQASDGTQSWNLGMRWP